MAKIMIGIKVSPEFKKVLQDQAQKEHRSLSNFIKHCLRVYLEQEGIETKEESD